MHQFVIQMEPFSSSELNSMLCNVRDNCDYFYGDLDEGSFSKSGVEGTYEIFSYGAKITLTEKPFLASWSMIEEKIRSLIS